jgi:hypothetical protein
MKKLLLVNALLLTTSCAALGSFFTPDDIAEIPAVQMRNLFLSIEEIEAQMPKWEGGGENPWSDVLVLEALRAQQRAWVALNEYYNGHVE